MKTMTAMRALTRTPRAPLLRESLFRRRFESQPPTTKPDPQSRVDKIHSRLPRFLQRYLTPLRTAPVTHVVAFLLLHEITAIAPIFALAGFFHYSHWMPPLIGEGRWISAGVEKFGSYFRRKGWLGEEKSGAYRWWGRGEGTTRWIVELATAYAITKAILPVRIVFSVWATPSFARMSVIPFVNVFKRVFGRKPKAHAVNDSTTKVIHVPAQAAAAGTGATGGGVVSKVGKGT